MTAPILHRLVRHAHRLVPSLLLASAGAAASDAIDWAQTARRDLQFAADTIAARHAGVIDPQASVTGPLATGLRLGLADAATVHGEQDYLRLIARFFAGFGDPHTAVNLRTSVRGWTGIVLDAVDGRYRVVWSEPDWPGALPPPGAIARTCDDVYTGTYLQLRVAPYLAHAGEYADTPSSLAREAMFDSGLGWTPAQCVFALPDGSLRRYALPLRSVPDQLSPARLDAVSRQHKASAKPAGLSTLAPGRYWVGMPDFNGARSGAAYEAVYARLGTLPDAAWVVFDLRGNGGGDSSWGTRALAALYGDTYAAQLKAADRLQKFVVADSTTVAFYEKIVASPAYAFVKVAMSKELVQVRAAIGAGAKMALVDGPGDTAPLAPALLRPVPRPHGPRLAAIIDRNCFSSCMTFLQRLKATGDAVVLGEPTIGYSPFGEISRFDLPSGRGSFYVPSAIYKGTQAIREPFVPDHAFTGAMRDTEALEAWVNRTLDDTGAAR